MRSVKLGLSIVPLMLLALALGCGDRPFTAQLDEVGFVVVQERAGNYLVRTDRNTNSFAMTRRVEPSNIGVEQLSFEQYPRRSDRLTAMQVLRLDSAEVQRRAAPSTANFQGLVMTVNRANPCMQIAGYHDGFRAGLNVPGRSRACGPTFFRVRSAGSKHRVRRQ